MKYLLGFFAGILISTGCASVDYSLRDSLRNVDTAGTKLLSDVLPMINGACEAVVLGCEQTEDAECPAYEKCTAFRDEFMNVVVTLKMAVLDAETALASNDMHAYQAAIEKAQSLVIKARKLIQQIGLI